MNPEQTAHHHHRRRRLPPLHFVLAIVFVLVLWLGLINHLRIEWSVNPQYNYCWAVPFLCLWLVWRAIRMGKSQDRKAGAAAPQPSAISPGSTVSRTQSPALWFPLFAMAALLFTAGRFIGEANPEWRFVSWALALAVIALTFLLLPTLLARQLAAKDKSASLGDARAVFADLPVVGRVVFAICFFLVAVPWPTLIEAPIVQGLARANTACAVELLGLFGVPLIQHGNTIETTQGMVGIDDACSGIRSFQATLMISLFFGELYLLSVWRRVALCFAGFVLAFIFNVGRTTLLTWVAARHGVAAISKWHDPAGVTILVACFSTLWLLGHALRNWKPKLSRVKDAQTSQAMESGTRETWIGSLFQRLPRLSTRGTGILLGWFVLTELAVEGWYRWHERHLPPPVTWTVRWPDKNPGFQELPLSQTAAQYLRFDEAYSARWMEAGRPWQGIFLRWKPGKIAASLAKGHRPEICLRAAGKSVIRSSELKWLDIQGLRMPVRFYELEDRGQPLHVLFCLWEDRGEQSDFQVPSSGYADLLGAVLKGRRNTGQRSIELGVWGISDSAKAETALVRRLELMIQPEKRIKPGEESTE